MRGGMPNCEPVCPDISIVGCTAARSTPCEYWSAPFAKLITQNQVFRAGIVQYHRMFEVRTHNTHCTRSEFALKASCGMWVLWQNSPPSRGPSRPDTVAYTPT